MKSQYPAGPGGAMSPPVCSRSSLTPVMMNALSSLLKDWPDMMRDEPILYMLEAPWDVVTKLGDFYMGQTDPLYGIVSRAAASLRGGGYAQWDEDAGDEGAVVMPITGAEFERYLGVIDEDFEAEHPNMAAEIYEAQEYADQLHCLDPNVANVPPWIANLNNTALQWLSKKAFRHGMPLGPLYIDKDGGVDRKTAGKLGALFISASPFAARMNLGLGAVIGGLGILFSAVAAGRDDVGTLLEQGGHILNLASADNAEDMMRATADIKQPGVAERASGRVTEVSHHGTAGQAGQPANTEDQFMERLATRLREEFGWRVPVQPKSLTPGMNRHVSISDTGFGRIQIDALGRHREPWGVHWWTPEVVQHSKEFTSWMISEGWQMTDPCSIRIDSTGNLIRLLHKLKTKVEELRGTEQPWHARYAGSWSEGTLKPSEIAPKLLMLLRDAAKNIEVWTWLKNKKGHVVRLNNLIGEYSDDPNWVEDAMLELGRMAPPGIVFGAHPGDGADFGFWRIDN